MPRNDQYLFGRILLSDALRQHEEKMFKVIQGLNADRVLSASTDTLADEMVEDFQLEVPTLRDEEARADQKEVTLDGGQSWRGGRIERAGIQVSVFMPFDGDKNLFYVQPSSYRTNSPRAEVRDHEIVFRFEQVDHDDEKLKLDYERELENTRWHLDRVRQDVEAFNQTLRGNAVTLIEGRKQKLLKDRGLVASLGIPLRRSACPVPSLPTPSVKRKVRPQITSSASATFEPEPALVEEEYGYILTVLTQMAMAIEKSPSAFASMGEEDLRHMFLVALNGHYEGNATGETFNFDGKTDILLRENARTVFIAECKFWTGPKGLSETIDQLLGYLSWRDTKTAVILFSQNKDFSAVLEKIPGAVKDHPNFVRELPRRAGAPESEFRYVFRQPNDHQRELTLTVLAFHVPEV